MLNPLHNLASHGHARRRTIYRCILLLLILAGCAPTQLAPTGTLPPITISQARLMSGGSALEVRGVNYIHPSSADLTKCSALQFGADGNCPWDIAPIAAD